MRLAIVTKPDSRSGLYYEYLVDKLPPFDMRADPSVMLGENNKPAVTLIH